MSERVARCHYCGRIFPTRQAKLYWVQVETLANGDELCITGVYCGDPCGEWDSESYRAGVG